MTFDQDLADARDIQGLALYVVGQAHPFHARHRTAIHANKVRVAAAIMVWVANFKSPNVVSKLRSADQFDIG